jgi:hypothetical protein
MFEDFGPPAREALLQAVEWNRQDLDAMAEQYAREQMAGAQSIPEPGYEVGATK